MRIAITGSSGKLGGLVAAAWAANGRSQRLVVRATSTAPSLIGAELARASYEDLDASTAALDGVDVLFMVSAPESTDRMRQHRTFIDAAVKAGVRHVVYTSFLGASASSTFTLGREHFATEQHLRASGIAFTFLRDNLYLDFLPLLAGPDGVIRGPAGAGVVAAVAREDVARVALAVLSNPVQHEGRTYELTGREALSLAEVARILTEVTGKPTRYEDESLDAAYESRASYGAPSWQVDAWVSTYTAIACGELALVNDNVERIGGAPALTLRGLLAR